MNTERIDVLAVMAKAHDGRLTTDNSEMWEARAAVAELIERERVMCDALRTIVESEYHDGETVVCDFDTLQGVARDALARVRGVA